MPTILTCARRLLAAVAAVLARLAAPTPIELNPSLARDVGFTHYTP